LTGCKPRRPITFMKMKSSKIGTLTVLLFVVIGLHAQRPVNKLTLESSYSMSTIHKVLRDLIDKGDKTKYFNDEFFITLLQKLLQDPQFSDKEKVQLFYLMQKKVGYAFSGADYIPPRLSYFSYHQGKVSFYEKVHGELRSMPVKGTPYFNLVDSFLSKDAIMAGSALLLGTLMNNDSTLKELKRFTDPAESQRCVVPAIFQHYLCICTSIVQDKEVVAKLMQGLKVFDHQEMKEDIFCAVYYRKNPVGVIRDYILGEKNQANQLAIQTALCALAAWVPEGSHKASMKALIVEIKDKWKSDLITKLLNGQIAFNYALSSNDQVVTKTWKGVTATVYSDGIMILNGKIMEFDPN
jgi:hypothetical protein